MGLVSDYPFYGTVMRSDLIASIHLPLVTVVTPSYNQGPFIRETIESVLSQDYPNVEYLVIDGGSTDETLSILKSYDSRFFWVSEGDEGQTHAINKGWKRSKGEIIAWLNSDDIFQPGAVRKVVEYFLKNPDVGAVYGEAYYINEDGDVISRYPTEPFNSDRLVDFCYICQPATFLRRSVVDDVGLLDESLNFCMDYEFWIRIAQKHRFCYLPHYLALSRLHTDCKTVRSRVIALREIANMIYGHYGFVPPSWLGAYVRARLESRLDRAVRWQNALFMVGVMGLGVREFMRYNKHLPFSEVRRWRRGLLESVKKMLAQRGNFDYRKNS
jgi:glycosyltransferase involved in cell wall biosynthesis